LYFRGLADPLENGPLSVLHQAVVQRQRIRVLIRYVDGIRGTTTGFVVAFDKHFNLLLRDVEEVYSRRLAPNRTSGPRCHSDPHPNGVLAFMSNLEVELLRRRRMGIAAATTTATATAAAADTARVEAEGASTDADASRSESFPTWSVRRRHMKQVLVRGDNVVLLYRADDERSSWPPSSQSPKFSRHRAARSLRNNVPPAERVGSPGSLINNYAPAASSMIERGREPTQQAGRAKRNNTSSSR
jgi:small nuclear ribonucleoprotein (snRNP)-like protein